MAYYKHKSEIIKMETPTLIETKRLAEDLLKNPEFAEKAIRDRNVIIKELKAVIEHQKIAYNNLSEKYEEVFDLNEKLIQDVTENNHDITEIRHVNEELSKKIIMQDEELYKKTYELESMFLYKIGAFCNSVKGWRGCLLRIFFTRPGINYMLFLLFVLLLLASFIGWSSIISAIMPIILPILKLLYLG